MNKQLLCKYILAISDAISFIVTFPLALLIINYFDPDINKYLPYHQLQHRIFLHIFLGFICVTWFWIKLRHYTYRKPFWFELKDILMTIVILAMSELAIIAFSKLYFSRYLWVTNWLIAILLVPTNRFLIKTLLIKTKYYLRDTIIIGSGKNAIDAYYALISEPYLGFKIKFFIVNELNEELSSLNIPIISQNKENNWELVTQKTDQFIIALEDDEHLDRDYWLRTLSKKHYRAVSVIPTLRGLPLYSTDMSFIFSYDLILLRINNNLAKHSSRIIKRTMDIILSTTFIVLLSPFFIILYLLIYKDGKNVIYGHTRIGQYGKPFKCLKFRTMFINAENILSDLLKNNSEIRQEWEKDFKLKNDPRLTKIGAWLRKTSLDELPQLFNVLKGEMSLIGPRPIIQAELEKYRDDVDYYLMAKPGMTGLWQISGRSNINYEMRVYLDCWYVKNWSLWNDIAILFRTIRIVLKRDGAY